MMVAIGLLAYQRKLSYLMKKRFIVAKLDENRGYGVLPYKLFMLMSFIFASNFKSGFKALLSYCYW